MASFSSMTACTHIHQLVVLPVAHTCPPITPLSRSKKYSKDDPDYILRTAMTSQLLAIARCCKALVACRVSPAQKAAIVKVVRKGVKPQPITLAIGTDMRTHNTPQTRTLTAAGPPLLYQVTEPMTST